VNKQSPIAGIFAAGAAILGGLAALTAGRSSTPRPGSHGRTRNPGTGNVRLRGQGVYVTSYARESPDEMADKLADAGLTWVCLPTVLDWRTGGGNVADDLPRYADAVRKVGITPWAWGWPEPRGTASKVSGPAEWYAVTAAAARAGGCQGILVNAENSRGERGWDRSDPIDVQDAKDLAAALRRDGWPWVLSSYPVPAWHNHFPWDAFLSQGPVIGSPQVYSFERYGDDFGARGVKAYQDRGFAGVVPSFGSEQSAGSDLRDRSPADQMLFEVRATLDRVPLDAIVWWSWSALRRDATRRAATRELAREFYGRGAA